RRVPAQAGRTWPGPIGHCVALPPCRRPEQPIRTRQCTADILSHQCRHPQWRWAATFGASPELHECATRSSVFTCRKSPYSSRTTPAKYLTYREKSALEVFDRAVAQAAQKVIAVRHAASVEAARTRARQVQDEWAERLLDGGAETVVLQQQQAAELEAVAIADVAAQR